MQPYSISSSSSNTSVSSSGSDSISKRVPLVIVLYESVSSNHRHFLAWQRQRSQVITQGSVHSATVVPTTQPINLTLASTARFPVIAVAYCST
jgi:hypothetical protein